MVRELRSGAQWQISWLPGLHVEPRDVRHAGQIGREQLQVMTLLHESFARNLTHSLGAYLRVVFATTLPPSRTRGCARFRRIGRIAAPAR